ncbi:MAG: methyltransferase domain-containing protein [Alphaproteobacteria bacterium]
MPETIAHRSLDALFHAGKAPYVSRMSDDIVLFDRNAVRRHRDRAAGTFGDHDFLHREIADRLSDRLADVNRSFDAVLDLGGGHGATASSADAKTRVTGDISTSFLRMSKPPVAVTMDEEYLPFADQTFDLAVSCLALHWVNDLPGALVQIRRALKPDGLFLAAILGGDTLIELRRAFLEAEAETTGGTSPHTSPVADIADAGALLQRAGFALPVIDTDTLTVTYSDMFALMRDLRGMGEANAVAARNKTFLRRDTLFAAAARYRELYGDADGRIPATFQIIWLTGWAPADTQQQPLRPGSAGSRLADALGADEVAAGDKANPRK